MGKMESTNEAMVEGVGMVVNVYLSEVGVTVRLLLVLVYPGMYPLDTQRKGQDHQQAVSGQ